MKISKQQMEIIVNSMMKELYDPKKYEEANEKLVKPYVEKFKKSKLYKKVEDAFKNELVCVIKIDKPDMLHELPKEFQQKISDNSMYLYYETRFDSVSDVVTRYKNMCLRCIEKPMPSEHEVRNKLELELTLKSLWAEDIYEVLDDIKASIKKQFNL